MKTAETPENGQPYYYKRREYNGKTVIIHFIGYYVPFPDAQHSARRD